MDTRFLESFLLVCERGSIAEAARRQNLTSTAVAQRVRALETEIGTPLIARVGRTVRPTAAGAAIADKARALLLEIRDLGGVSDGESVSGTLQLGSTTTAMTGIMPGILKRLSVSHPGVEVYILPGTSMDLYDRVLGGDLDAALVIEPPFPLPKTCEARTVREEAMVLIAPSALAGREPHELLRNESTIRYDRSTWGGMLATEYLRLADIDPDDRYELDALEAIAAFVHEGLGVALVPDWAPPWPAGLDIVKLKLPIEGARRRIQLVWDRGSARLDLIGAFLATIEPERGPDRTKSSD